MNGIFAVNKPVGMTSHDVVNLIRRKTGIKRVGHGGALDPLAEGILIIAVGRENTKLLDKYIKGEKEYLATLKLGYVSETDDAQGPIYKYKYPLPQNLRTNKVVSQLASKKSIIKNVPTEKEIKECLKKFTGNISQTPPVYSSIKFQGKPAHRRVRRGENVELKPREVFIKSIKLMHYSYPDLNIKVICGPGVYIRSLAKDIGEKLQTGSYMSGLLRTKVGKFNLKSSLSVEDLKV